MRSHCSRKLTGLVRHCLSRIVIVATVVGGAVAAVSGQSIPSDTPQFKIAEEFGVQLVARHEQTGSLAAMTFNEFGQILAARENGPLLLIDGLTADKAPEKVRVYCDKVKNIQGILSLSGDVYVTGDGPDGVALYRLRDRDRDRTLEDIRALVKFKSPSVEHGPHGLTLGPDGMIYVVVGNHASLVDKQSPHSPYHDGYEGDLVQPRYEDPGGHASGIRGPGGTIVRTDIEGKTVEIVAGGLRNPYDLAFNREGELFTHDADMESDEATAWYRPNRVLQVISGAEFGWRSGWAKWPDYYVDSVPAVIDTGRGSPTGAVVYDHFMFPARFHGTFFSCDWSEGQILVVRPEANGAGYTASKSVFLEGQPLTVTDIEVGPDGWLYFVTGGRGTRGGIYRVVWHGTVPDEITKPAVGIERAIRQPQVQSAWARQQVAATKKELGEATWSKQLSDVARNRFRPAADRARALDLLHLFGPGPTAELLTELTSDEKSEVRKKAVYFMGLLPGTAPHGALVELLDDTDAQVRRQACESLVRSRDTVPLSRLEPLLASEDRFESWAAMRLLERSPADEWQELILSSERQRVFITGSTALLVAAPSAECSQRVIEKTLEFMQQFVSDRDFVDLLRLQQLALMRGELPPADVPALAESLAKEFPAGNLLINRELVRLLAYLRVSSPADRYLDYLRSDVPATEKLHVAAHLQHLSHDWSAEDQRKLLQFYEQPTSGGGSVIGYVRNFARATAKSLSDEARHQVLAEGAQAPAAALAVLYDLPAELTPEQFEELKSLDEQIQSSEGQWYTQLRTGIVAVLAQSGTPEAFEYLRTVYDRDVQRRADVALALAEQPDGDNWDYLLRSLPVLDKKRAREILKKLQSVDRTPDSPEAYRQVIQVGWQLQEDGAQDAISLLEKWQNYAAPKDDVPWETALRAWKKWFVKTYPREKEPQLIGPLATKWDLDLLLEKLTSSTESTSPERGAVVFAKAQCAKCHRYGDQGEAMGPDLTTIGKRFMRREILQSIVHPSLVISDQYSAKHVTTINGHTFTGIVGAGTPQELIVLQADGNKQRVLRNQVDDIVDSKTSAMPTGLLDSLTEQEVHDLMSYLTSPPISTIGKTQPKPSQP